MPRNTRSLNSSFRSLTEMTDQIKSNMLILCTTELWLSNSYNHLYKIKGYKSHHLIRVNNKNDGQVVSI